MRHECYLKEITNEFNKSWFTSLEITMSVKLAPTFMAPSFHWHCIESWCWVFVMRKVELRPVYLIEDKSSVSIIPDCYFWSRSRLIAPMRRFCAKLVTYDAHDVQLKAKQVIWQISMPRCCTAPPPNPLIVFPVPLWRRIYLPSGIEKWLLCVKNAAILLVKVGADSTTPQVS